MFQYWNINKLGLRNYWPQKEEKSKALFGNIYTCLTGPNRSQIISILSPEKQKTNRSTRENDILSHDYSIPITIEMGSLCVGMLCAFLDLIIETEII